MGNQNRELSSLTYIEFSYNEAKKMKDRHSLLILTATDIETEILHQKMHPFPGFNNLVKVPHENHTYYIGTFGVYGVVHVQCEMGATARGGAIIKVSDAIDVWEPKAVIMCGIAFGIDKKSQNIGDVLVSDAIIPYDIKRVGKDITIQRGPSPRAGALLFDRFKSAKEWDHTLPNKEKAKIITAFILSGESLIDNIEFRDSLLKVFPNAKGGEMEGAGLYAAADNKNLQWIVVKGICDYADGNKSKNKNQNQRVAAESAISLCLKVFSSSTGFQDLEFLPIEVPSEELSKPGPPAPAPLPPEGKFFKTSMSSIVTGFVDFENQLWVTDGQQIQIFNVNNADSIDRWPLKSKQWKKIFHQPWQNSFLFSDWEGGLYMFNEKNRGEGHILRTPKYDDLPIHCMGVGEQGHLVVGTWDGKIFRYNSDKNANHFDYITTLASLPIRLVPLFNNSIAIADQSGALWLLDSKGKQDMIWKSDLVLKDIWAHEESNGYVAIIILEEDRLVQVNPGKHKKKPEVIKLDSKVVHLSHMKGNAPDKWTALVMEGGIIDWLSLKPFRILDSNRVTLDFEVQHFTALYDPQQPTALIGVGLGKEGNFFSLKGGELNTYSSPSIEQLILDHSGRFVFQIFKNSIEWMRNPAVLPMACKVEKVAVKGNLTPGVYKEITVILKNTGTVPIYKIKTQLKGHEHVIVERVEEKKVKLLPGQTLDLDLSVKAKAVGVLNLELRIEMEDEAGPPTWNQTIDLKVESKGK